MRALPRRILVSGATGIIGRALSSRLRAQGSEVVAWGGRSRRPPIADLGHVDAVVHLAGPASIPEGMTTSEAVAATCGVTHELLGGLQASVGRWVFASTGLVYGERHVTPVDELALPDPPNLYAALKLATEALFAGLPSAEILRFATVYSAASKVETLVGTILEQASTGPVVRVRDTSPVRDLLYLDDAVAALEAALAAPMTDGVRISNVAGPDPLPVGEVARCAALVAGWDPEDVVVEATAPPRGGQLVLNGRKLETWSGWKATTRLEDGFRQSLRGMRERTHG